MIGARTPHKLFRALPPRVYYGVTYRVKFVRLNVMLLLLPFPGEVTAWLRCGGKIFVKPVWTNRFRSRQWNSEQDGCIMYKHAHARTRTHLTALCPGLPGWAGTRKVEPIWILLKKETVSGSGISWAICKSASRSRQITMPVLHHYTTTPSSSR